MSTPHINAKASDIAATVLMPGDPLRAKYIADNYLHSVKEYSGVRGIYAYTGVVAGDVLGHTLKPADYAEPQRITVMASGMGMPSIGIYSYELYTHFGVENIIRIGTAGGYDARLQVGDLVLATAAYSDSSFALVQNGETRDTLLPSPSLNDSLRTAAAELGAMLHEHTVHSSDVFYQESAPNDDGTPYWQDYANRGIAAVEMESFALFHNANVLGKHAACLLTVSNSFATGEEMPPEVRERGLDAMVKVATAATV